MTGKYSVIFLHDGGSTHRWRIGPALVRSLLFLLVLIPALTAASMWLNWRLWQSLNVVRGENLALRRQVESNAQTTARLANLEQFLRKTDPQGLDDLLPSRSGAGYTEPTPVPSSASVGGAQAPLSPAADVAADQPTAEPSPASQEATAAATASGESADASGPGTEAPLPPLPTEEQAAVPAAQDTPNTQDAVDTGLARVENLNARRVGARSLRISFDLYNTEQVPQLAGKAMFELILADGSIYPLDDHGDTGYRINRLKKIVGNPTLPAEVSETKDASIRVSVFADDALIYRVVTPLHQ